MVSQATAEGTLPALIIRRDDPRVDIKTFVGRDREITVAEVELARHRLVTLKGPGGVGKTRLAQQIAARAEDRYADGVVTVELATIAPDEDALEGALLRRFGLLNNNPSAVGTVLLMQSLKDRELLLVLDNAEHLVAAADPDKPAPLPGVIAALLAAAPGLHVLVTSQFRLGLGGAEYVLDVPPLSYTAGVHGELSEAVQLLRDRVAALHKPLETEQDYEAASRLCRKLDGVALAIEMAAGLRDGMTLPEILEELDHPMDLLVAEHAEHAAHRSLHTTMRVTYGLLDEPLQRLWVVLSCFPDTFDVEAASAVAVGSGVEVRNMRLALAGLVHSSVLTQGEHRGRSWYRMLAPIRYFGVDVDPALLTRARTAHAGHFAGLAARAAERWYGPDEVRWMYLLDTHMPSARAAVTYLLELDDQPADPLIIARMRPGQDPGEEVVLGRVAALEMALHMCSTRYFTFAGVLNEARRLLDTCLAAQGDHISILTACALALGAWTATIQGKQAVAADLLAQARDHLDRLGEDTPRPLLVEYAEAAFSFISETDPVRARMSVTALHQLGVSSGDPMCWLFAAIDAGFHSEAHIAYEIARTHLANAEARGAEWAISWALWAVALVEHHHGDPVVAWSLLQRALDMQVRMGDTWGPAWTLWLMAVVVADAGNHLVAVKLMAGAWARQRKTDVSVDGLQPWLRVQDTTVAACMAALSPRRYEVEVAQAQMGMSYDDVVALALGLKTPTAHPVALDELPGGLTAREYQAVRLLAGNPELSNRTLAVLMGIEIRSVEDLMTRARKKTGVTRRAGFAGWLADQVGGRVDADAPDVDAADGSPSR